jgi:hypothetical protein
MTLAEASEAYQAMLEAHRAHPDNTELHEDMIKARAAMEIAWIKEATQ